MKDMVDINNNKVDTVYKWIEWQQIFPHNFIEHLGKCDKEGIFSNEKKNKVHSVCDADEGTKTQYYYRDALIFMPKSTQYTLGGLHRVVTKLQVNT